MTTATNFPTFVEASERLRNLDFREDIDFAQALAILGDLQEEVRNEEEVEAAFGAAALFVEIVNVNGPILELTPDSLNFISNFRDVLEQSQTGTLDDSELSNIAADVASIVSTIAGSAAVAAGGVAAAPVATILAIAAGIASVGFTFYSLSGLGAGQQSALTVAVEDIGRDINNILGSVNPEFLNETFNGTNASETIFGGAGNDVINGGGGADFLVGGSGSDTIDGGDGNDILRGNGSTFEPDLLRGGNGSDTYLYQLGDGNTIIDNSDADANSVDVLVFIAPSNVPSITQINLEDVRFRRVGTDLELTVLLNDDVITVQNYFQGPGFELDEIQFNNGAITVTPEIARQLALEGTERLDIIEGHETDDTINGLGGNDIIFGGEGDDTIDGGLNNDRIFGQAGNDTLRGGDDVDTLDGGIGSDTLFGGDGGDTLRGGDGADELRGEAGNDTLEGGAGLDLLHGGQGRDTLLGGAGADSYFYETGDGFDTIIDSEGINDIYIDGRLLTSATQVESALPIYQDDSDDRVQYVVTATELVILINDGANSGSILIENFGSIDANNFSINFNDAEATVIPTEPPVNNDPRFDVGNGVIEVFGMVSGIDGVLRDVEENTIIPFSYIERLAIEENFVASDGSFINPRENIATTGLDLDITELAFFVYPDEPFDRSNPNFNGFSSSHRIIPDQERLINLGLDSVSAGEGLGNLFLLDRFNGDYTFGLTIAGNDGVGDIIRGGVLGDNSLAGRGGDDQIFGLGGYDVLIGGDDSDYIEGGEGNDEIIGGFGDADLSAFFNEEGLLRRVGPGVFGTSEAVVGTQVDGEFVPIDSSVERVIETFAGTDIIRSSSLHLSESEGSSDTLLGQQGDDFISGREGDDLLDGGTDNDSLFGGDGNDTLVGGAGTDELFGDSDFARFFSEDFPEGVRVGSSNLIILPEGVLLDLGLNEIDQAEEGVTYDDILLAGDGNDILHGEIGDDILQGEQGDDQLFGDRRVVPISVFGETLFGSRLDPLLHGNDTLSGGEGNDELFGQGGDDTLIGGADNDLLLGDDVILTSDLSGSVLEGQFHGNDFLDGGLGDDQLFGGGANDTLIGGEGIDRLFGDNQATDSVFDNDDLAGEFHGDDFLDGGAGADQIVGGGGNDTLLGGVGNDEIDGDDGINFDVHGRDTIDGGDGDDFITGGGNNDIIAGGSGDDQLIGDGSFLNSRGEVAVAAEFHGDDEIDGGAGNDTIFADGGSDTILGGSGDDQIFADGGYNTIADDTDGVVNFQTFSDAVVDTAFHGNDIVRAGEGNDTVEAGSGDDIVEGEAGNDTLYGGAGNDVLIGGEGNDLIVGGEGNDQLIGGSGSDSLLGGDGDDVLIGGASSAGVAQYLAGQAGDDTYIYQAGDGPTIINDVEGWNRLEINGTNFFQVTNIGNSTIVALSVDGTDRIQFDNGSFAFFSDIFVNGQQQNAFTIEGSSDTDRLIGGPSNNTFEIPVGSQNIVITNNTSAGSMDVVRLPSDATSNLLTIGHNNNDIVLAISRSFIAGGQIDPERSGLPLNARFITLENFLAEDGASVIDRLELADGTVFGSSEIIQAAFTGDNAGNVFQGTVNSDVISGLGGRDVLEGNEGDDELLGGSDNDTYLYSLGDGDDVIDDIAGTDTLRFSDVSSADVTLTETVLGLLFSISQDGEQVGSILLRDSVNNPANQIERIEFNDIVLNGIDEINAFVTGDRVLTLNGLVENRDIVLTQEFVLTLPDNLFQDESGNALDVSATLVDGSPLPDWLSFNSETLTFSGVPGLTDVGDVELVLIGSNGNTSQRSLLTLNAPDEVLGVDQLMVNSTGSFQVPNTDVAAVGTNQDETIVGSFSDDQIIGGGGNDLLLGGSGDDDIIGSGELQGGRGNDSLIEIPGSSDDELRGDEGDDVLVTRGGSDELFGDEGNDTFIIAEASGRDIVREFEGVNDRIILPEGLSLSDFTFRVSRDVDGTPNSVGDESLVLEAEQFNYQLILSGFLGSFRLLSASSPDSPDRVEMIEFANGDVLTRADLLSFLSQATNGNDILYGFTDQDDNLSGLDGDDVIFGIGGANIINGGEGNDTLNGGSDSDQIFGGDGNDILRSVGFTTFNRSRNDLTQDLLDGGAGDDQLIGERGDDTLIGGSGNDILLGDFGSDLLEGGSGNDELDGGGGGDADTLSGGEGEDILRFDSLDQVDGGAGNDTFILTDSSLSGELTFLEDFTSGILDLSRLSDVEFFRVGSDLLVTSSSPNSLDGLTLRNWFNGQANQISQIITSTTTYSAADINNLFADGIATTSSGEIIGSSSRDFLEGSVSTDTITGGADNDYLVGGDGNDVLDGGAGLDLIDAGGGDDTILLSSGNDVIEGGDGFDTLVATTGNDVINLSSLGNADNITLSGIERIDGGDGSDTVNNPGITNLEFNNIEEITGITVDLSGATVDQGLVIRGRDVTGSNLDDRIFLESSTFDSNANGGAGDDIINLDTFEQEQIFESFFTSGISQVRDTDINGGEGFDELVIQNEYRVINLNGLYKDIVEIEKISGASQNEIFSVEYLGDTRGVAPNVFNTDFSGVVTENISFQVGQVLGRNSNLRDDQIFNGQANFIGSDSDDTITVQFVRNTDVRVDGGLGNDLINIFDDHTVVFSTIENEIIRNSTLSIETNISLVEGGFNLADVTLSRVNDDLIISVNGTTNQITYENGFRNDSAFATIQFVDQTLTSTDINDVIANGGGNPNIAPVAVADSFTGTEDQALVINVADLLANDTDANGDSLSIVDVSNATNGSVSFDAQNQTITFTPDANYNGPASFDYTISDGALTSTTSVAIDITAVNDAPVAGDDVGVTDQDTAITLTFAELLSNDSDIDGDALTISNVGNAQNGTISLDSVAQTVTFTPDIGYFGPASFDYTVSDGELSDTATVNLTVNEEVNIAPVAVVDSFTGTEDQALVINVADLLANDSDANGDSLSVVDVSNATNGSVSFDTQSQAITFIPDANYNGPASFDYAISDGALTSTSSVTIDITAVNDAPVAGDDAGVTDQDIAITLTVAELLSNDSDIDGDALTISGVGNAQNGTISLDSVAQTVTFTPDAGYFGPASFDYTISDGELSDTATVNLTVNEEVNVAPVAVADSFTGTEDQALVINVADLLANDTDANGDSLSVVDVSNATNGSVSFDAQNQTITFTPDANYSGPASFDYTISDGTLESTASVAIDIAAVNDTPVALDDNLNVNEDTALSGNVLLDNGEGADSDVDGDSLSVDTTPVTGPANGSLSLNSDGSFVYTPNEDFNGSDSFTYQVDDGNGGVDTATVTINVSAVADAVDDTQITDEENASLINVLANDSFGPNATVTAISQGANGSVEIIGDGEVRYTPNNGFNGADSYTYTVTTAAGDTETATVNVVVNAVNDGPNAIDDAVTTDEDQAVVVDVLSNDSDIDGSTLIVTQVTDGANGSAQVNADGTITYTPNANFNGSDTLSYTIADDQGALDTATVTITVEPVNDSPVATDDTAVTDQDTVITLTFAELLSNDSDIDGDALTITAVGNAANGGVSLDSINQTITFTPDAGYFGPANFDYTISDGELSDTGTVNLTVNEEVNVEPVAVADSLTGTEDQALVINVADLLANDTDANSDSLSVVNVSNAANGSVSFDAQNQTITFTPDANYNGPASFDYTISDGTLTSTASVAIDITSVNDAPLATDDTSVTDQDTVITLTFAELLSNDTDLDGDALTITAVSDSVNGSVSIDAQNEVVIFTPDADYFGPASFDYTVSDGDLSDIGTVNLTVNEEANVAPVAVADSFTGTEDQALVITAAELLSNDTDANGDSLTIADVFNAANGTVSFNVQNQTITFTPDANYNGPASFDYSISDGDLTSTASVDIDIAAVNDAPVATDDAGVTDQDISITLTFAELLSNDNDIDGDALTITEVSNAQNGSVSIDAQSETVTFTPDAGYFGPASFDYTVSDGDLSDTGTVNLTVNEEANVAPVAVADSFTGTEDQALVITAAELLSNDTDANGDSLTIVDVSNAANGTVSFNVQNQTITFTPDANYNGPASFDYSISDGDLTSTASVAIDIAAVNDAPIATDDAGVTDQDTAITLTFAELLSNDSDIDGDTLTISSVSNAQNGNVSLDSLAETVTFTPNAGYFGPASFDYTLSDGELTDTGTVNLTVNEIVDTGPLLDARDDVHVISPFEVSSGNVISGVGVEPFFEQTRGTDVTSDSARVNQITYRGLVLDLDITVPPAPTGVSEQVELTRRANVNASQLSLSSPDGRIRFDNRGGIRGAGVGNNKLNSGETIVIDFDPQDLPSGVENVELTFNDLGGSDRVRITARDINGSVLSEFERTGLGGNNTPDIVNLNNISGIASIAITQLTGFDSNIRTISYDPTATIVGGSEGSLSYVYSTEVNANGESVTEVTITDSADSTSLSFRSDGFYAFTSAPSSAPTAISVDTTSQANVDAADFELSVLSGGSALAFATNGGNSGFSQDGIGVAGGNTELLNAGEALRIRFDDQLTPNGVNNISLTLSDFESGNGDAVTINVTHDSDNNGVDELTTLQVSATNGNSNESVDLSSFTNVSQIDITHASGFEVGLSNVSYTQPSTMPTGTESEIIDYILTDTTGQTDSARLTISTVENTINGTSVSDTIIGDARNNAIDGRAGNDSASGNGGQDTISGGFGNDTLNGNDGDDILNGNNGDDVLRGGRGRDVLIGGEGSDQFIFAAGDGQDVIDASDSSSQSQETLTLEGINQDELWFSRSNNDLLIDVNGSSDQVRINSYFVGDTYQIDTLTTDDAVLSSGQIDQLVAAMSAFGASQSGGDVTSTATQDEQQAVITAAS